MWKLFATAILVLSVFAQIGAIKKKVLKQPILWDSDVYHYVIVGGGTAGCILANRLSENRRNEVLLLEAGVSDQLPGLSQVIETPLLLWQLQGGQTDWQFTSEPHQYAGKSLVDRKSKIPQGKVLGGTSSTNGLVYMRGSKHDFDSWGLDGWSYDDVLPYFKKSESNNNPDYAASGFHGTNGPLSIEDREFELSRAFVDAGVELGYSEQDLNGAESTGFMQVQASTKFGRRHSTAEAFLRPVLSRPNLHVRTLSQVIKIITKGKGDKLKAIGVEYVDLMNPQVPHFIKAKKEVIVCAGAFNSPKLLMLSGIGPTEHLAKYVQPVLNLPVGQYLDDHVATELSYVINASISWTTAALTQFGSLANYVFQGQGFWASSAHIAVAKFHSETQPAEDKFPYLNIEQIGQLLNEPHQSPAAQLLGFDPLFFADFHQNETFQNGMVLLASLYHQTSLGKVELRGANPFAEPSITFNTFRDAQDVQRVIEAIRKAEALVNTDVFQQLDAKLVTKPHPGCLDLGSFNSDEYWECYMKHNTWTLYHYTSTCKMGADGDATAVTDERLRVRGMGKLRVVDASAIPNAISANTMATVMMVAEKAADMILEDN